jgi:hypothetical protein
LHSLARKWRKLPQTLGIYGFSAQSLKKTDTKLSFPLENPGEIIWPNGLNLNASPDEQRAPSVHYELILPMKYF